VALFTPCSIQVKEDASIDDPMFLLEVMELNELIEEAEDDSPEADEVTLEVRHLVPWIFEYGCLSFFARPTSLCPPLTSTSQLNQRNQINSSTSSQCACPSTPFSGRQLLQRRDSRD
jgi:hypothetical protein